MRKTKMVCTIGPACDDENILRDMIDAGMDVARINMSHGTHQEQIERINRLKKVIEQSGKNVAILVDTRGPEVRVGSFPGGQIELKDGQGFMLRRDDECAQGDISGVCITYPRLIDVLMKLPGVQSIGTEILLDDGKLSMLVCNVKHDGIYCRVEKGGILKAHKSLNIPSLVVPMPFVSQADRDDIKLTLSLGAHYIAASFARSAEDILTLRDYIVSLGYDDVEIIAKIENRSGVDNIDSIIRVSDGIMVARGDMGVEIPFIQLPAIQKSIIRKCVAAGKYVITATQMLESMTVSPLPTRAEVNDVANAVFDGSSAVMLSGESAVGRYPVQSVKALANICLQAEKTLDYDFLRKFVVPQAGGISFRITICAAALRASLSINASAIIVESRTGRVARAMAMFKPNCPIIAVVTDKAVCMKLTLNWGITAVVGEDLFDSDAITQQAIDCAIATGIVRAGDNVVIISSNRAAPTSGTDTLNIRIV